MLDDRRKIERARADRRERRREREPSFGARLDLIILQMHALHAPREPVDHRAHVRAAVLEVNNLPVLNPDIVTAIGLMLLFIVPGIKLSLTTLILAHITFCIPYVILTIMPKLRQLDDNVAEAALDLGANPWQALTRVILPQIYPAILSGALIAFSMSFDDFVISFFTAGVGVNNISMYVYSMKRFNPSVNALSTLIVVVVTLILVLANLIPVIKDKKTKREEQRL